MNNNDALDGDVRQRHTMSSPPTVSTVTSNRDNNKPRVSPTKSQSRTTTHHAALHQSTQYRPTNRPLTAAAAAAMHSRPACPPINPNHHKVRFPATVPPRHYVAAARPAAAAKAATPTPAAGGGFSTSKTLFILAVIVGCFAMLYPRIFHPMVRSVFHHNDDVPSSPSIGDKLVTPPELLDPALRRIGPSPIHQTPMGGGGRRGPHPGMRGHEHGSRGGGSGKGYIGTLLPLYAIGVIGFLCFTLFKILFKPKNNTLMPGTLPYGTDPNHHHHHHNQAGYYVANGQYYPTMAQSPATTMTSAVYQHHPNCPSSSGCEMYTKPASRYPIIDALRRLQVNGETLAETAIDNTETTTARGAKRKILDEAALPETDVTYNAPVAKDKPDDTNESVTGDFDDNNNDAEKEEETDDTINNDSVSKPPDLDKVQQKMAETQHKINSMKQDSMKNGGEATVKPADFVEIQQQLMEMQQQMQAMMKHVQQTQPSVSPVMSKKDELTVAMENVEHQPNAKTEVNISEMMKPAVSEPRKEKQENQNEESQEGLPSSPSEEPSNKNKQTYDMQRAHDDSQDNAENDVKAEHASNGLIP